MTSPTVMSFSVPPLAAMISAQRDRVRLRAATGTHAEAQWARSRAKPSGSRDAARLATRQPLVANPASSQLSEGRTMSAAIATTSAPANAPWAHLRRPAVIGQPRRGHLPPRGASGVGSARSPALLPGGARLIRQPADQQLDADSAQMLAVGVVKHERRQGQPLQDLAARPPRGRP